MQRPAGPAGGVTDMIMLTVILSKLEELNIQAIIQLERMCMRSSLRALVLIKTLYVTVQATDYDPLIQVRWLKFKTIILTPLFYFQGCEFSLPEKDG